MFKSSAGAAVVTLAILACQIGWLAGCGDNSRDCGPGTVEEGGHCLPAAKCGFGTHEDTNSGQCVPDETVCSDGTAFDPLTGMCTIDPSACQNGTVLIDHACVDPTADLVIDVQEGPEPNGLGLIEQSDAQAGNITLKAVGGGAYVVHGTIKPWRDFNNDGTLEPDVDTYVLTIATPSYLHVTADGVGGMAAGFVAIADVDGTDPLADWQRVGLSLVSDTAIREVFLPKAGTYRISIADTRTLLEYVTSGGYATAAPGDDNSQYYVALTQQALPAATALTVSSGAASVSGALPSDKLALYTVQLGTGLNTIRLAMPSALANAAFVVLRDGVFATHAIETGGAANALVGDVAPGATTTIVVDQDYTLLPTTASFTLDVTVSNAPALSTIGGMVSALATTNIGTNFSFLNLWSFDVPADDSTMGIQIGWSHPMVGEIYDSTGTLAASFTPPTSGVTWNAYRGLVRIPRAGRYYFAVYSPSANSSTTLTATSTIEALTSAAITEGTPLTAPVNVYRAVPFTYAAGTDPWQQFDVTGVNTGGQLASWFDPAITYGRLDSFITSIGTVTSEIPPIFTQQYPTGGGAAGHVMLSDGTTDYLVKVNALAPTTTPSVSLTFAPRAAVVDLGTVLTGSVSRTNQTIDTTTTQRYYLFRTTVGKTVTITVTPTSNLNTQFRRLKNDETALGALINTSTNGADVETFTQNGADWTAFVVSSAGNLSGSRTFDVSVQIQ